MWHGGGIPAAALQFRGDCVIRCAGGSSFPETAGRKAWTRSDRGEVGVADGRSARRDATRQKLFEATMALIAEQGFSDTTVDQIAERAGVAKGTVYYNFASKSVLFEELLRYGVGL